MLSGHPPLMETSDRQARMRKTRFLDVPPIQQVEPGLPHYVIAAVNRAMALDPAKRFQTPSAMLLDLTQVEARLVEAPPAPAAVAQAAAKTLPPRKNSPSWSSNRTRNCRTSSATATRKAGYRVLVTADAERALKRFLEDRGTADAVLFSAAEMGQTAIEMFNRMIDDDRTKTVPAILLLAESQADWKPRVSVAAHRLVLSLPLTIKDLRAALTTVLESAATKQAAGG